MDALPACAMLDCDEPASLSERVQTKFWDITIPYCSRHYEALMGGAQVAVDSGRIHFRAKEEGVQEASCR